MKMQVLLDSSGAVLGMSQPLSMQTESGTVAVSLVAGC